MMVTEAAIASWAGCGSSGCTSLRSPSSIRTRRGYAGSSPAVTRSSRPRVSSPATGIGWCGRWPTRSGPNGGWPSTSDDPVGRSC